MRVSDERFAPIGALGMAGFLVDLALANSAAATASRDLGLTEFLAAPRGLRIAVDVVGLAAAGGIFILPISTALQVFAPRERLARTLAGVNILSSIYIVAGSLGAALLQSLAGLSEPVLLAGLGLANIAAAWFAATRLKPPPAASPAANPIP